MTPVIEIQNVNKSFKDVHAVRDLSMTIYEGEYVALLGPNGAGKTTLVEMIEGLQKPDSGNIRLLSKTWAENSRELHRQIGLSLQETQFMEKITVFETLNLFGSFFGLDEKRSEEILELVNLQEKRKAFVSKLSGGQRQRLALGIAIINEPKILLLDEPTTGLDPTARREIWDILTELKARKNTTMILTTHYMEEAEYLCDRILIMDQGKFLAQGTLEELITSHGKGEIIEFTLNEPLNGHTIQNLPGMKSLDWENNGTSGRLVVENIAVTLPALIESVNSIGRRIETLESHRTTLDDLFVTMTGRRLHE